MTDLVKRQRLPELHGPASASLDRLRERAIPFLQLPAAQNQHSQSDNAAFFLLSHMKMNGQSSLEEESHQGNLVSNDWEQFGWGLWAGYIWKSLRP